MHSVIMSCTPQNNKNHIKNFFEKAGIFRKPFRRVQNLSQIVSWF